MAERWIKAVGYAQYRCISSREAERWIKAVVGKKKNK